jgi:hypothetical protein
MSWLSVASRFGYSGELPGVQDTYLDFSKNTDDSFAGSITVGTGKFEFSHASMIHLAALILVASGGGDAGPHVKPADLGNLGKSIDLLVKSQYVSIIEESLQKAPKEAGAATAAAGAQVPQKPTGPAVPATEAPRKAKPVISRAPAKPVDIKAKKPTTDKATAPEAPILPGKKATGARVPKVKATPSRVAPSRVAPIKINAKKSECPDCGVSMIKNEKFVGCLCFREFAPEVQLIKHGDESYIQFSSTLEREAASAILEALGVR